MDLHAGEKDLSTNRHTRKERKPVRLGRNICLLCRLTPFAWVNNTELQTGMTAQGSVKPPLLSALSHRCLRPTIIVGLRKALPPFAKARLTQCLSFAGLLPFEWPLSPDTYRGKMDLFPVVICACVRTGALSLAAWKAINRSVRACIFHSPQIHLGVPKP